MLRTWDIPGTIKFYTELLGFEFVATTVDEGSGWASLHHGDVSIMLSGPNEHEGDTHPAFTGSLYFNTGDVDQIWEQVHDKARVCYPIEDFEYGMREFAVYDNNGYLLQFGREIG
jgi:uncharacterized glyoxalase superfamily protein PhnB